MLRNPHGGNCCGIHHIWDMGVGPNAPDNTRNRNSTRIERLKELIAELDDVVINQGEVDPRYNNGRVKEVVLADYQMHNGWPAALAELGFQKVASFLNSNSDNVCHVFYKHPALTLYGNERQPAVERVVHAPAPVPPRQEVREILTEYFPSFRVGGRGRPFSSVQEVRDHAPLVRRIERRTVFSDGTITWDDV